MLAHKAEEEGIAVAEILKGEKPHIDYNLVPNVIYTWPEVSSVGRTEQQLIDDNVDYKVGKFPMRALGRSRASSDLDANENDLEKAKAINLKFDNQVIVEKK